MYDSTTPWTIDHKAPLSLEFSRQEHWSGLPFPSPKQRLNINNQALLVNWKPNFVCSLTFGHGGPLLLCAGSLLLAGIGGYSLLPCVGFSLQGFFLLLFLLGSTGCRHADFSCCTTQAQQCGLWAQEWGLSGCGAGTWLLVGMYNFPSLCTEPMSSALASRFLSTVPLGKSEN